MLHQDHWKKYSKNNAHVAAVLECFLRTSSFAQCSDALAQATHPLQQLTIDLESYIT